MFWAIANLVGTDVNRPALARPARVHLDAGFVEVRSADIATDQHAIKRWPWLTKCTKGRDASDRVTGFMVRGRLEGFGVYHAATPSRSFIPPCRKSWRTKGNAPQVIIPD